MPDTYGLQGCPQDRHSHRFGMFKFLCLPFGLGNTGNKFKRMMDQILGNLPYCFVSIDYILMFSPNLTSHIQHLRDILELCRAQGLTIGLGKCEFVVPETELLGHCLTSCSLQSLLQHTSAVRIFPLPSDKPGLQRFLGMINFYRRFLHNTALLHSLMPSKVQVNLSDGLPSLTPPSAMPSFSSPLFLSLQTLGRHSPADAPRFLVSVGFILQKALHCRD